MSAPTTFAVAASHEALVRLDFTLDPFLRLAWVSDGARQSWAPRLQRVLRAWEQLQVATVAHQVRRGAIVRSPLPERSRQLVEPQLAVRELADAPAAGDTSPAAAPRKAAPLLLVALPDAADALAAAWHAGDTDTIGRLLGYPDCCCRAYREHTVRERWLDPIWPMAAATPPREGAAAGAWSIDIAAHHCTNILWRCLGIQAVPHVPCRATCADSVRLAEAFLRTGADVGFRDEVQWLEDILSWPVEWTALHGIAEIKTPLLRISTRTDATAAKLQVRWIGEHYPGEGAKGLSFPYRTPDRAIARQRKRETEAFIPLRAV